MNEVYMGFTGWDILTVVIIAAAVAFLLRTIANFIDESVWKMKAGVSKESEELDLATVPWSDPIKETDEMYVFRDGFPVTEGHLLFVPKYNDPEAVNYCLTEAYLTGVDMQLRGAFEGFNIGLNQGETAGQTVMWPHVHLIPRRTGDMKDPRGGVRHVIPSQGNYRLENSTYIDPRFDKTPK
jgi:diadenosine tetraphosphate (Ap4A) HIT family hydrolase